MESAGDQGELMVFVKWTDFLEWLLPVTAKFPRNMRFSLAQRIDCLALDVVEDLVEARYSRNKSMVLERANLKLEKIRVLMRISHRLRYLSGSALERSARSVDEAGRMLGGWIRQQKAK